MTLQPPQSHEFEQKWETQQLAIEFAMRERHRTRSVRAFRRFYFWCGIPGTLYWLSLFDVYVVLSYLYQDGQLADRPQWDRDAFCKMFFLVNFLFGPLSCVFFGLFSGVAAWGWLQLFPDSIVGDFDPRRGRDPMPALLNASLLVDDAMVPMSNECGPTEQRSK